jgi:hypothetical protein
MPTQKLTAEIINAAIEGFESQKLRLDSQIDELRQLLNAGGTPATAASGVPGRKRTMSAAGRRRIAAAQKARWAKIKGEGELVSSPAPAKPAKKKRKLSAAGRKAISEATKRRWALRRAEAENLQAAGPKKAPAKGPAKAAKKTPAGKGSRKKSQGALEAAGTAA